MKLILWLILGLAVLYILRNKKKPSANQPTARAAGAAAESAAQAEVMLRCADCGVYLPASEVLYDLAGKAFCSDEHRRRQA